MAATSYRNSPAYQAAMARRRAIIAASEYKALYRPPTGPLDIRLLKCDVEEMKEKKTGARSGDTYWVEVEVLPPHKDAGQTTRLFYTIFDPDPKRPRKSTYEGNINASRLRGLIEAFYKNENGDTIAADDETQWLELLEQGCAAGVCLQGEWKNKPYTPTEGPNKGKPRDDMWFEVYGELDPTAYGPAPESADDASADEVADETPVEDEPVVEEEPEPEPAPAPARAVGRPVAKPAAKAPVKATVKVAAKPAARRR